MHLEFVSNQARFFELWNCGQSFEKFTTFELNVEYAYKLQELATNSTIQLRSSQTEYVSATNRSVCQFVGFGACVE